MLGLDAQFKVLGTAIGLAFALVALATGRRRAPHWALASFFALIALNQAAEAARATGIDLLTPAGWQRVAAVASALDPLALFWFAAVYPAPNAWHAPRRLYAVTLVGAVLALWAGWLYFDPYPPVPRPLYHFVFPTVLLAYTAFCYGVFLLGGVQRLQIGGSVRERLLVVAAGIAFFRPMGYLTQESLRLTLHVQGVYLLPETWGLVYTIVDMGTIALAFGVFALLFPRASKAMLPGALVAVGLLTVQIIEYATSKGPAYQVLLPFAQGGTAIRFLLVGSLLSVAILRHDALGATLRERRIASRILIGLTLVTVGVLLLSPLTAGDAIPPWALVVLGSALLLSQGFQKGTDSVAWRLFAVPPPGDPVARVGAYRTALRQAALEGRDVRDPAIVKLPRELDIEPTIAGLLEETAERERGPLRVGEKIAARYDVRAELGSGTGGRVFLARDEKLARDVVLKEVPAHAGHATELALREARAAGEAPHPNVVTLYDVLTRASTLVLVTEFVAGGTLGERIARGPMGPPEAIRLAKGILDGAAAIHGRGVVHRDLKPDNILLTSDGVPKLADFGLARLGGDQATRATDAWTGAGTPAYMAPEQRRGAPATTRSDVYAIGLVLRNAVGDGMPPGLAAVVARATADEPEARYADAREMLADLEARQRAQ